MLNALPGFPQSSALAGYLSTLAALGMTLFYVLSGFIIHYNYREVIQQGGPAGYWQFFVARFARLYPLYLAFLAVELLADGSLSRLSQGDTATLEKLLIVAPYYLTLSQSWFYQIVGGNHLIYQFGQVGAIAWSISTEWFFYFAYPLICISLLWLRGPWPKVAAIAVLALVAFGAMALAIENATVIEAYALRYHGPAAVTTPQSQASLYQWILYYSPYSRITEFILGVLTCGVFLDLRSKPVGRREQLLGLIGMLLAITSIAVIHLMMFDPHSSFPRLAQFRLCFGYALPVALFILCAARYRNAITRALEWPPIVAAGEASYSLYLLHVLVIGWFFRLDLLTWSPEFPLGAWVLVGSFWRQPSAYRSSAIACWRCRRAVG